MRDRGREGGREEGREGGREGERREGNIYIDERKYGTQRNAIMSTQDCQLIPPDQRTKVKSQEACNVSRQHCC